MTQMFGKAGPAPQPLPELPKPTPVRMPVADDPALLEAAQRRRESMMRRAGRMSTILSDNLREVTGSSGTKLGN